MSPGNKNRDSSTDYNDFIRSTLIWLPGVLNGSDEMGIAMLTYTGDSEGGAALTGAYDRSEIVRESNISSDVSSNSLVSSSKRLPKK